MLVAAGKDTTFPATGIFLDQVDIAMAVANGKKIIGVAVVQLRVKHKQNLLFLWAACLLHTAQTEHQAGGSAPIFSPLQHLWEAETAFHPVLSLCC